MTNEEAIKIIDKGLDIGNQMPFLTVDQMNEAKQKAIKALSQQTEDAISRQAVLDIVNIPLNIRRDEIIKKLPAVKPQDCDTCEVGNPCMYCKHEFEPQESEETDADSN